MAEPGDSWATWDFEGAAQDYDVLVAGPSPLYARYAEVLDSIVRLCHAGPGKRVLDIGTGTGNLALRCLQRGARVVALDPSEAMLARARTKLRDTACVHLRRAEQPFLEVPFPDSHFDAVVSSYAFHHVPPPLKPRADRVGAAPSVT